MERPLSASGTATGRERCGGVFVIVERRLLYLDVTSKKERQQVVDVTGQNVYQKEILFKKWLLLLLL